MPHTCCPLYGGFVACTEQNGIGYTTLNGIVNQNEKRREKREERREKREKSREKRKESREKREERSDKREERRE